MADRTFRSGPALLTTTVTATVLNSTVTSLAGPVGITLTQPYLIVKHVRVVNRTATAAFFALWLGASGAAAVNTEIIAAGTQTAGALDANRGVSVAANSFFDWYGNLYMTAADFMTGGAGTANALTFQAEGTVAFI